MFHRLSRILLAASLLFVPAATVATVAAPTVGACGSYTLVRHSYSYAYRWTPAGNGTRYSTYAMEASGFYNGCSAYGNSIKVWRVSSEGTVTMTDGGPAFYTQSGGTVDFYNNREWHPVGTLQYATQYLRIKLTPSGAMSASGSSIACGRAGDTCSLYVTFIQ